jgi:probable nitrogen fixation protein
MSSSTELAEHEIIRQLVKQIRANDTHGENDRLSTAELIAPFILTKEQKHEIPLVGDPDEQTLERVQEYYNAVSSLVEEKTGLMAIPTIHLSHEGFGRALITVGRLVVYDRTLRDVHRYGYSSVEHLESEADKALSGILELIERYREVAEA